MVDMGFFNFLLATLLIVFIAIPLAVYIIKAFAVYSLVKRTKQQYAWISFVPILQDAKIYRLAGFTEKCFAAVLLISGLFILVHIPLISPWILCAKYVLGAYVRLRTAKNFGCDDILCVLNVFFEPFVLLHIALSKKEYYASPMNKTVDQWIHRFNLGDTEQSPPIVDAEIVDDPDRVQ